MYPFFLYVAASLLISGICVFFLSKIFPPVPRRARHPQVRPIDIAVVDSADRWIDEAIVLQLPAGIEWTNRIYTYYECNPTETEPGVTVTETPPLAIQQRERGHRLYATTH